MMGLMNLTRVYISSWKFEFKGVPYKYNILVCNAANFRGDFSILIATPDKRSSCTLYGADYVILTGPD